jgi:hypothetical protein
LRVSRQKAVDEPRRKDLFSGIFSTMPTRAGVQKLYTPSVTDTDRAAGVGSTSARKPRRRTLVNPSSLPPSSPAVFTLEEIVDYRRLYELILSWSGQEKVCLEDVERYLGWGN